MLSASSIIVGMIGIAVLIVGRHFVGHHVSPARGWLSNWKWFEVASWRDWQMKRVL
jgi:hypothetical protein